jgi:hypothetical protein
VLRSSPRLPLRLIVVPLALSGCVAAAEKRATNTEAAHGAPPPAGGEPSAMQVIAGTRPMSDEHPPADAGAPDRVWVHGYWHWSGVRYQWIPAHWEPSTPDYARAAPR